MDADSDYSLWQRIFPGRGHFHFHFSVDYGILTKEGEGGSFQRPRKFGLFPMTKKIRSGMPTALLPRCLFYGLNSHCYGVQLFVHWLFFLCSLVALNSGLFINRGGSAVATKESRIITMCWHLAWYVCSKATFGILVHRLLITTTGN